VPWAHRWCASGQGSEDIREASILTEHDRPDRGSSFGRDAGRGFSEASQGLALGLGFTAPVILMWLAGRALDGVLGTGPWVQVAGAVCGWVVGFFYVYYAVTRGSGR
jgi:F0F1-type ATP synthase assembly protein I